MQLSDDESTRIFCLNFPLNSRTRVAITVRVQSLDIIKRGISTTALRNNIRQLLWLFTFDIKASRKKKVLLSGRYLIYYSGPVERVPSCIRFGKNREKRTRVACQKKKNDRSMPLWFDGERGRG